MKKLPKAVKREPRDKVMEKNDRNNLRAKPLISQVIVVEGRDDTQAILRAVDATTIETHGYGISRETWERIEKAYETKGIIIFTDPDRAGENIRKRIKEKFPQAQEAFLSKREAHKEGDIGIENASPEDIVKALNGVKTTLEEASRENGAAESFSLEDMDAWGLSGGEGSAERRTALGEALGIGYGNSRAFLKRLNGFGIKREEIEKALLSISKK